MALKPTSKDDGPVKVHLDDGNILTFDRLRHHKSEAITFYDVGTEQGTNRIWKEGRAKMFPMHRIEEIEYVGY